MCVCNYHLCQVRSMVRSMTVDGFSAHSKCSALSSRSILAPWIIDHIFTKNESDHNSARVLRVRAFQWCPIDMYTWGQKFHLGQKIINNCEALINYASDKIEVPPVLCTLRCLSLQTMSLVAKRKAVEQLYEYQARQAGFAVFDTITTNIHQRLSIFRVHHQKCAARRRNALGYELRQEDQRTEWLKRKYMDNVRQQQTVSTHLDSTNARGFVVSV